MRIINLFSSLLVIITMSIIGKTTVMVMVFVLFLIMVRAYGGLFPLRIIISAATTLPQPGIGSYSCLSSFQSGCEKYRIY